MILCTRENLKAIIKFCTFVRQRFYISIFYWFPCVYIIFQCTEKLYRLWSFLRLLNPISLHIVTIFIVNDPTKLCLFYFSQSSTLVILYLVKTDLGLDLVTLETFLSGMKILSHLCRSWKNNSSFRMTCMSLMERS